MSLSTILHKSAEQTTALQDSLLEIAQSNTPYPHPIGAAEPLIAFNGYYALNSTGSFLSIDTNLMVNNKDAQNPKITPHLVLVYSENGTDSVIFDLTGANRAFNSVAWDAATNTLTATGGGTITVSGKAIPVPTFSLTFSRKDGADFVTSSFTGYIANSSGAQTTLNGTTYNNPIPMDMYHGTYYMDKGEGEAIMVIGTDNTLQYNYSESTVDPGALQQVDVFIYNLNMYVFSFPGTVDNDKVSIIMGTSAKAGMVCNDLTTVPATKNTKGKAIPRNLQTGKESTTVAPVGGNNAQSELLAAYAGFYRFSGSNGYLSLEGTYKTDKTGTKTYTVTIGVSEDGINSTLYTFDESMQLEPNEGVMALTIPNPDGAGDILNLTFSREYTPAYKGIGPYYGYVINVTGSVNGSMVTGGTLLNVVPIMGFSGSPLLLEEKGQLGLQKSVQIISDVCVEYFGQEYKELTVVPLMYIVAFHISPTQAVLLSLGTDGGKGVCSLTTEFEVLGPISIPVSAPELYSAIPFAHSGAHQN
ncbi:MAG: hypothetical protein HEP71_26335 [Roseivirga sp.]|nr:hypothetical protein [Roseivirga sp.]